MFTSANTTSLTKSLGYTKAKTYQFRKIKEEKASKKHYPTRFGKKSTLSALSVTSPTTSQTLLSNTSTDTMIELSGMGPLPPAWVDIYEEGQEKIKKIKDLYKDIQKLIATKIKMQFGNHEDLDAQIDRKNAQATNLLQDCEINLSKISKMSSLDETPSELKIRKNIEKALATQIQEVAILLRKQQKGLLDKMKELNGTGASSELNVQTEEDPYSDDLQEMIMVEDIAKERDEDINKLIDNVNKLNQLFRDMNQIVIEQGTIIDRIDYNIEKASDNTTRAKKELFKARKAMDSKCGAYCIKMLITLNVIFTILLIFKFAHK